MKRLRGNAYKRWYEARERETLDHVKAVLREASDQRSQYTIAFPEIQRQIWAETATGIIVAFLDLADRVREANGNGDDGQ